MSRYVLRRKGITPDPFLFIRDWNPQNPREGVWILRDRCPQWWKGKCNFLSNIYSYFGVAKSRPFMEILATPPRKATFRRSKVKNLILPWRWDSPFRMINSCWTIQFLPLPPFLGGWSIELRLLLVKNASHFAWHVLSVHASCYNQKPLKQQV